MKILSRIIIALVICVAALASMSSAAFGSQLVYADEFTGPLNTATWANATPWNTQYTIGELEFYDPADCTLANGLMTLKSENRTTSGYSWTGPFAYTSGIATSLNRAKFSYGYFEIRAKLPKGPGIWPAFWLTNDSTLEIDGLEMLGDRPSRIYQTLHENKHQVYQGIVDGPDYSAGFHTYGIDWQPTYVKWYIDGVLTTTYNAPMPSDPLNICLNTAVGGSWPGSPTSATTFPVNYDIDYVRVYDTKPVAPVAIADAYSTSADATLTVPAAGVLANDKDSLSHTLTAATVTQPAHGKLSLRTDGSFVYVPAPGYSGTDSFKYIASDGVATSGAATVSLAVLARTSTVITKPVVKKKSGTRTASVKGSVRVGSISGVTLASYSAATTPVVLKVCVQRHGRTKWSTYSTKLLFNPASKYATAFRLRTGKFRVRTLVSGGRCVARTSLWSKTITIR